MVKQLHPASICYELQLSDDINPTERDLADKTAPSPVSGNGCGGAEESIEEACGVDGCVTTVGCSPTPYKWRPATKGVLRETQVSLHELEGLPQEGRYRLRVRAYCGALGWGGWSRESELLEHNCHEQSPIQT